MFARMDERDWLLINEDKRPDAKFTDASSTGKEEKSERELQVVFVAKSGEKNAFCLLSLAKHHEN